MCRRESLWRLCWQEQKNQKVKGLAAANKIICYSRLTSPWKRSSLTWAGDLTQTSTHIYTQSDSSCSFRSLVFSSLFLWNIVSFWYVCFVVRISAVVLNHRSVCLCVFRWLEQYLSVLLNWGSRNIHTHFATTRTSNSMADIWDEASWLFSQKWKRQQAVQVTNLTVHNQKPFQHVWESEKHFSNSSKGNRQRK